MSMHFNSHTTPKFRFYVPNTTIHFYQCTVYGPSKMHPSSELLLREISDSSDESEMNEMNEMILYYYPMFLE